MRDFILLFPISQKFIYLLSRYAAAADFFGVGRSGSVLLNKPHLLDTVDTVPTVLNPIALSISPPITTATSRKSFLFYWY